MDGAIDLLAQSSMSLDTSGMQVVLTSAAATQVKTLCEKEGRDAWLFRVSVEGGGCSGFQYKFDLADQVKPDDYSHETDGVTLLIDQASLPLMNGGQVDYVVQLVGSMFVINNPQAASGCGCGTSFSIG